MLFSTVKTNVKKLGRITDEESENYIQVEDIVKGVEICDSTSAFLRSLLMSRPLELRPQTPTGSYVAEEGKPFVSFSQNILTVKYPLVINNKLRYINFISERVRDEMLLLPNLADAVEYFKQPFFVAVTRYVPADANTKRICDNDHELEQNKVTNIICHTLGVDDSPLNMTYISAVKSTDQTVGYTEILASALPYEFNAGGNFEAK